MSESVPCGARAGSTARDRHHRAQRCAGGPPASGPDRLRAGRRPARGRGIRAARVFSAPVFVVLVLAVMFGVAVWTAARRLPELPGSAAAVVIACGCVAVV